MEMVSGPSGSVALTCRDCNHKEHEPDQCKQCNCGWSELIRPSVGFLPSVLDGQNFYVSGAIYDRKGQVREVLKERGREGRRDGSIN